MLLRTALMVLLLSAATAVAGAQPRGDPEHPDVRQITISGQMFGQLRCSDRNHPEEFGATVNGVGDVNHDGLADWTCSRVRCDTAIPILDVPIRPLELLLYTGVRGGLPAAEHGLRIGPTEVGADTKLLAAGDWDDDGNQDLAVRISIFNDTSYGNPIGGYNLSSLVVFWGDNTATYSIDDTSRLSCGAQAWFGPGGANVADIDRDGVDDLALWSSHSGFSNGAVVPCPAIYVYRGHHRERWGRGGISNRADIEWWNPPPTGLMKFIDHDCDSFVDLVLYDNAPANSNVSVLYGRRRALPDTNETETVNLRLANGHYAIVTDVTGDGVPELAVNTGSEEKIKLFAGSPGQRLRAQYGTGIEPQRRPWAAVTLPHAIHDGWEYAGFSPLYDLGDVGRDGVNDLWTMSWPFLVVYNGGQFMDHLIDADFDIRPISILSTARLGDIDGSGRTTFALGSAGRLTLFKEPDSVPVSGIYRELPHPAGQRCEHATSVPTAAPGNQDAPRLVCTPNPARDVVEVWWGGTESGELVLGDAAGLRVIIEPAPTPRNVPLRAEHP